MVNANRPAALRNRHLLRIHAAVAAGVLLLGGAGAVNAQGRRAHLSSDLQQHLDAGDSTTTTVIVSGTSDEIAAVAARHGARVRRLLTSGAVLEIPAGRLEEVAADTDVPQLSGDHVMHGQMAVTDQSIGADQAWTYAGSAL